MSAATEKARSVKVYTGLPALDLSGFARRVREGGERRILQKDTIVVPVSGYLPVFKELLMLRAMAGVSIGFNPIQGRVSLDMGSSTAGFDDAVRLARGYLEAFNKIWLAFSCTVFRGDRAEKVRGMGVEVKDNTASVSLQLQGQFGVERLSFTCASVDPAAGKSLDVLVQGVFPSLDGLFDPSVWNKVEDGDLSRPERTAAFLVMALNSILGTHPALMVYDDITVPVRGSGDMPNYGKLALVWTTDPKERFRQFELYLQDKADAFPAGDPIIDVLDPNVFCRNNLRYPVLTRIDALV